MYEPVMWCASSLARNNAAPVISSGAGIRPVGGRLADQLAPSRFPLRAGQQRLGLYEPGRESVDANLWCERLRVGLGDPEQAVFARGVLRCTRTATDNDRRTDVDDRAAVALRHPLAELVHHQHCPLDVDGQHVVDRLLGDLRPRGLPRGHVTDVVDQHVDTAALVERELRHTPDVAPGRDVALDQERLRAGVADAVGGALRSLRRAAVVDHHARPPSMYMT